MSQTLSVVSSHKYFILRSNNNNSQTLLTKLTFKGATIDVDDEDELADEDTHAQV
jgi:hypothetical protein